MDKISIIALSIFLFSCNSKRHFAVTSNGSDVLYIGLNNYIDIKGNDLRKITVSAQNGTLIPVQNLTSDTIKRYNLKVDNSSDTYLDIKNGNLKSRQKFRNKALPDPDIFLTINGRRVSHGAFAATAFKDGTSLGLGLPGFDFGVTMRVISFNLTIIKADKRVQRHVVNGHSFKDYVNDALRGDIFVFHDVLIEIIDTKEKRTISGGTFTLN